MLSRPRLSSSTAIALHMASFLSFCSAEPLSTGAAGRVPVHVPPGGLAEQGQQVHCVRGNGFHLAFNFVYSKGGPSGFEGRLTFWGLWVSRWKSNR